MSKYRDYTDEDIIEAVKNNTSKAGCLRDIGLAPKGGNYKTLDRAIKRLELNTDHFKGHGWRKNRSFGPKRELNVYLNNDYKINSHKLKKKTNQRRL